MLFIVAIIAAIAAFIFRAGAKKRLNKSESSFALIGIVVAMLVAFSQLVTVIPA